MPEETIAEYRGRYDAGYEVLRVERLKKQVARYERFRQRADAADNGLDNLGKAGSYISYAPGWALAASGRSSCTIRRN